MMVLNMSLGYLTVFIVITAYTVCLIGPVFDHYELDT